ncbi:hypothetical protein TIFTF001_007901 [Ficus carica]|uniref:Uncharacterized protein n=1 Tax=Ficus carica TaxID=3494 RepID=A0AA88D029_FICCA|nr:hypothetical protein TIFTF001_007901 [Ficus carica]
MGVSFKVSRMGTRYMPKPPVIEDDGDDDDNGSLESQQRAIEGKFAEIDKVSDFSNALAKPRREHSTSDDIEVSFSLNLFPTGFSVGNGSELFNNVPEHLYPYDRSSETLISAIEYGWLPGVALDDLPFKYVNGSILCQIRDYRNCLFHKGGTHSTQNIPVVHRVLLKMCMENVVKDILSISDDSWTYKDHLEFESRILKVLQPDLYLNPQPLPYKHYREPLAKKINLEISWSWEQREQQNARASNQVFNSSCHVTEMPSNSAGQNPNLPGLVHQDKVVMLAKESTPTAVLNQGNNLLKQTISDSNALTSQPSCQNGGNRDPSALTELPALNVFTLERSPNKCTNELTPSSSKLSVKERCEKQAIQSSLLEKLRIEPVNCSFQQFPGKRSEFSAPVQLQWKDTSLPQHIEAEGALQEILQGKACHSQFIKNGQPANREAITINSQAGSATSTIKLKPAEACHLSSEFWSIQDKSVGKDRRFNRSDGLQLQDKQSTHLIKTNNPLLNTLPNHIVQPVDKQLKRGNAASKRKSLVHPELRHDESPLATSQNVDSLQVEASAPSRQRTNPPKGFGGYAVGSSVKISNVNMVNAKSCLEGNHLLSQPLEIKSDAVLERLQKIGGVTQRYELSKKRKLDPDFERKPFSVAIPRVAYHLANCEDSVRSEEMANDKVSLSKPSVDRNSTCNSRTLLFIQNPSSFYQDNRVDRVRVVLEQKLNKETVEANIVYGCEDETRSAVNSILPAFPTVHAADLFAAQFISVMAREGYDLYSDIVRPMPANIGCSSSVQQLSGTAHQSSVRFGLSPSPSNPGLTRHMLNLVPGNMSAHNSGQLLLKKTSTSANVLPPGIIHSSSLEHTRDCLPDSLLDIASQFSSMPLEMSEILSRHVHLQEQVQQRVTQQKQLRLRKAMLGGCNVTPGGSGTLQLGNGIQGLGNFSLASFDSVTGNDIASRPRISGGHMALTGNICPENSRSSNALGVNDSKHLEIPTSKFLAAISAKVRATEGQWRGLASGVPIQRSDVVAPMNTPKVPKMPSTLSSQQQHQLQIYQPQQEMQRPYPFMLQQQDMRLSVQNRGSVNLAKKMRSSLGQVDPQQYARQHQINHQEPNPGSMSIVLAEMENSNVSGFHGIVERSQGWK